MGWNSAALLPGEESGWFASCRRPGSRKDRRPQSGEMQGAEASAATASVGMPLSARLGPGDAVGFWDLAGMARGDGDGSGSTRQHEGKFLGFRDDRWAMPLGGGHDGDGGCMPHTPSHLQL